MILYSYTTRNDSVFADKIESVFESLVESGLFRKYGEWNVERPIRDLVAVSQMDGPKEITFNNFIKIANFYFGMLSKVILVFLGEILWHRHGESLRSVFRKIGGVFK